jgi:hypothetical protein
MIFLTDGKAKWLFCRYRSDGDQDISLNAEAGQTETPEVIGASCQTCIKHQT